MESLRLGEKYKSQLGDFYEEDPTVLKPDFATEYPEWAINNYNAHANTIKNIESMEEPVDLAPQFAEASIENPYDKLTKPFIEKMNINMVDIIDDAFDKSYDTGCLAAIRFLSEMVGVRNLHIIRDDPTNPNQPTAEQQNRTIKVPMYKGDKNVNERDRLTAIEAIAHDMWHVYQHDVAENGGERAEFYKKNFDSAAPVLIEESENHQPLELETQSFSKGIHERYYDLVLASLWRGKEGSMVLSTYNRENGISDNSIAKQEVAQKRKAKILELIAIDDFKQRYNKAQ